MVVDPVGASLGALSLTVQLLDGCVKCTLGYSSLLRPQPVLIQLKSSD